MSILHKGDRVLSTQEALNCGAVPRQCTGTVTSNPRSSLRIMVRIDGGAKFPQQYNSGFWTLIGRNPNVQETIDSIRTIAQRKVGPCDADNHGYGCACDLAAEILAALGKQGERGGKR